MPSSTSTPRACTTARSTSTCIRPSGSREEILTDIRSRLAVLPVSVNVGQPISHRLDHMLSGVRAQIALKIFGDDLDTLRTLAEQLRERLATIPGLVDLQVERQVRIPQVQVTVDYQRAALYGVTPSQVTEALEALSNGRVVSQIIDGNRRFDVVLRLADADRTTAGLSKLMVETPVGRVPLGPSPRSSRPTGPTRSSATTAGGASWCWPTPTAPTWRRWSRHPRRGRRHAAAGRLLHQPRGHLPGAGGGVAADRSAVAGVAGAIFIVLYSRYRSSVLALIIMGNIPLALIGSVIALWIAGQPLSVATMIGFITLAGISARNGILKISHYINLVLHEGETFGRKMIVRGSLERLTPVLMTALSAGFALLPLMIGADAPGKEILHPVAIVIFGGLITSTLLDTLLTPLLFQRFGAKPLLRLRELQQERTAAEA